MEDDLVVTHRRVHTDLNSRLRDEREEEDCNTRHFDIFFLSGALSEANPYHHILDMQNQFLHTHRIE